MLILDRKTNQAIFIGKDVKLRFLGGIFNRAKFSISARKGTDIRISGIGLSLTEQLDSRNLGTISFSIPIDSPFFVNETMITSFGRYMCPNKISLGFSAPEDVIILREEIPFI